MTRPFGIIRPVICIAIGAMIAALPVRFSFDPDMGWRSELSVALADSGKGKGGDDDDNDSHDDDDDDSGSGSSGSNSGSGSSGSNSGSGSSGSKSSSNSGSGSGSGNRKPQRGGARGDIHLDYSNGWDEMIAGGQYVLTDPKGRTVSRRRATQHDYDRMQALISD